MTHDVFICHSSKDRTIANAICSKLEQNRIRCWIAPRDVVQGRDYAASIIEAISEATLTMLVFSDNSNRSAHVHREIERTVGHGIPILPLRVDDVVPSPSLEYFISNAHWLDAITPPMEQHLDHVIGTVRLLLDRAREAAPSDVARPPAVTSPQAPEPVPETGSPSARAAKLPTWWRWAAIGAVAVAGAVIVGVLVLGGRDNGGAQTSVAVYSPPATASSEPATRAGTVKLGNAITLHGIDAASKTAVTAMKVVDPTTSSDGISTPDASTRYMSIEFQIMNTGTIAFEDPVTNDAQVLDAAGNKFDAVIMLSVEAGPVFPTSLKLLPGETTAVYVIFQVPTTTTIATVKFTMDSGYGLDSGRWTVK